MEFTEPLQAAAAVVSLAILASAACSDIRTREVPDIHWASLGLIGSVLYALLCVSEEGMRFDCLAVPACLLMEFVAVAFLEGKAAVSAGAAAAVLFFAVVVQGDSPYIVTQGLVSAAAVAAYAGLYYAGVLRGGADAKCLMLLSIALPYYPEIGPFPLMPPDPRIEEFIPPSLSVLFVGAVIAAAWALIWYAVRTDRGRMRLDEAAGSFVWICSGEDSRGEEKEAAAARLMSEGASDAKVVYQIPFIAPLAIASAAVVLLGSPLFIL